MLRTPSGPGVRDDSCAYEGVEISSFYDPLVSKLCVWAPTRRQAIERMRRALREHVITGIRANIPFHVALFGIEAFVEGRCDTGVIGRHEEALLTSGNPGEALEAMVLGAAIARAFEDNDEAKRGAAAPTSNGTRMSSWRRAALAKL